MGRHGTIAGRKEKQDSKRAAMFTKYARAITVAAKNGGDPEYNVALKHAIDKAKGINMPNDNIKRAIKKGTGELAGENYETGSFEGYGAYDSFQFVRNGYFCIDAHDSTPEHLVFNRIVSLKSSFRLPQK